MRSSLLALEKAVDFLDAPDEFPLIWLAEPCTSVQRWAYVANSGHIWLFSFQGRHAWFRLPTSPHDSQAYPEESLVYMQPSAQCILTELHQRLVFSSVHRYTKQYL